MKRLKSVLFAAAAAVALAGGSSARADINWAVDWSPSNSSITAMNGTVIKFSNLTLIPQTTSATFPTVTFTATNLSIGPLGTLPDNLGPHGQNFQMQAFIVDPNGTSKTAFLTGNLSGTIQSGGANIAYTPIAPTQTLTFQENDGSTNTYVVSLTGFSPPGSGSKGLSTVGGLGGEITVTNTPGGGGGSPHDTPEPSTLALGGLGMMFTGLMGWLRRNRKAAIAG
jgi:hypothetical protein